MPRRENTKPNFAAVDAIRKSIGSCMVAPTPTAAPFTAAITGLEAAEDAQDDAAPAVAADAVMDDLVAGGALVVVERIAARDAKLGASTESPARSGDHDRADLVVCIGEVEQLDHLAHDHGRERVHLVGAIEGRDRNAVRDLEIEHGEVGHVSVRSLKGVGRSSESAILPTPSIQIGASAAMNSIIT